jgi:adenylate kinase family enzyme
MSGPGRRFLHLDFGELLRAAARHTIDAGLGPADTAFVQSILDGTLLEPKHFHIAGALIRHFLSSTAFQPPRDILVLNGFPRTIEQSAYAKELAIEVKMVILSSCTVEVAMARKRMADAGIGHEDRSGRGDGNEAVFHKKIDSFVLRTQPLIGYYRSSGAEVAEVTVAAGTTPEEAFRAVENRLRMLAERLVVHTPCPARTERNHG